MAQRWRYISLYLHSMTPTCFNLTRITCPCVWPRRWCHCFCLQARMVWFFRDISQGKVWKSSPAWYQGFAWHQELGNCQIWDNDFFLGPVVSLNQYLYLMHSSLLHQQPAKGELAKAVQRAEADRRQVLLPMLTEIFGLTTCSTPPQSCILLRLPTMPTCRTIMLQHPKVQCAFCNPGTGGTAGVE